jgi:chromosome segregation ATPase
MGERKVMQSFGRAALLVVSILVLFVFGCGESVKLVNGIKLRNKELLKEKRKLAEDLAQLSARSAKTRTLLQQENSDLKQENEHLRKETAQAKKEAGTLNQEMTGLKDRNRKLEKSVADLKKQCEQAVTACADVKKKNRELTNEAVETRKKYQALGGEVALLKKKNLTARNALKSLSAATARLKSENAELRKRTAEISRLTRKNAKLKKEIARLKMTKVPMGPQPADMKKSPVPGKERIQRQPNVVPVSLGIPSTIPPALLCPRFPVWSPIGH